MVALGLLVDNVVVIVESVQNGIEQGISSLESAKQTVKELALPLTAATGTTVAAFVPMLGSQGATADFTRAIPLVVVISLITSFFLALTITPILSRFALKPHTSRDWKKMDQLFESLGKWVSKYPKSLVVVSSGLAVLSFLFFPLLPFQFFPSADRNQLVVDLQLPEGTHYTETNRVSMKVEQELSKREGVDHIAAFIGRGTPRFFYNLNQVPRSPHVAQLIVIFENAEVARISKSDVEKSLQRLVPEALVIVRSLEQGPPTKAPVEYRISAPNLEELYQAQESLVRVLRNIPGATKVRSTIGVGSPVASIQVNDASSSKFRIDRSDSRCFIVWSDSWC